MDKFIDLVFSVSPSTTVGIRMSLLFKSFSGGVELEWPEEVVSNLEVSSACGDFVDEVLNTNNTGLSEFGINNFVIGEGDSALVDLSISSFVDKIGDGLLGGVTISNIWLNLSNHVDGGLVQSDEDTIVKLPQSQKLHDLFRAGWEFVDTIEKNFMLISNIKG